MRISNLFLLFFITIATIGCAKPTTLERHQQGYESEIIRQNEILIIPPVADVNTVGAFGSKEKMYDYEFNLEDLIQKQMVPAIEAKGYKAQLLHKRTIAEQHLNNIVMPLRDEYALVSKELYSPAALEEEKAFSINQNLGKFAIELGEKTHSDLILITDYSGAIKTNGARTADFIGAMLTGRSDALQNSDASTMLIAIIDAKNGNLLWSNMGHSVLGIFDGTQTDTDDVKRIDEMIKNILEPLQARNMPIKPKNPPAK